MRLEERVEGKSGEENRRNRRRKEYERRGIEEDRKWDEIRYEKRGDESRVE